LSLALGKEVKIADAVTKALPIGEKASSPGMKYKHYSPKAAVTLFEGSEENFFKELNSSEEGTFGLIFEGEEALSQRPYVVYGREHDADSQARGIFSALRLLDEKGARLVYARSPEKDNEALGVYNRMLRAAAFRIKKV
ncbi:MAG: Sua5 family C-terminal domain-containing protein, partial [Oscillospiraceae bacterium]